MLSFNNKIVRYDLIESINATDIIVILRYFGFIFEVNISRIFYNKFAANISNF